MMRAFATATLLGPLCVGYVSGAGAQQSTWTGVYAREQAKRGQALYAQECASCHGPSLQGAEQAPALTGPSFAANWNGRTLGALFETMRLSMPSDDPGKLTVQENADLLAYMLAVGKFPASSTELPADRDALDQIVFLTTKR
jgi:quinoprotein glucose dehydrogenase